MLKLSTQELDILGRVCPLISQERLDHTLGVVKTVSELARRFDVNEGKIRIAALLHDLAKDLGDEELSNKAGRWGMTISPVERAHPDLLHAAVGAELAREMFAIDDEDILQAIRYHNTGRPGMGALEKVLYVADVVEPGRSFPCVNKLRELVGSEELSLDELVIRIMKQTLMFVIQNDLPLHHRSVFALNYLLLDSST